MATNTEWAEFAELNAGREGQPIVALDRTIQENTVVLSNRSYMVIDENGMTARIISNNLFSLDDDEILLSMAELNTISSYLKSKENV
ncbi:hypothetical protein [Vibrio phage Va2]|nr:hypothetical protein [Vibrio phage Va2]